MTWSKEYRREWMKRQNNGFVGAIANSVPYTDIIRIGDAQYARNSRGLHVPIETLDIHELRRARFWVWRLPTIQDV